MLRSVFSSVRRPFFVAASTLILSSASPVAGQVPTTLEPIRADQNLRPAPQPKSVPRKEVSLNNKQLAPKDAASLSFTFKELIFQGNAALSSAELASLWPHKAGDQVTIEAVFALANAVTKRYADAGYALCFGVVPEQDIKDGKVKRKAYRDEIGKWEAKVDAVSKLEKQPDKADKLKTVGSRR